MRDWSSDVCSSDLRGGLAARLGPLHGSLGRGDRHAQFRRLGSDRGPGGQVRVQPAARPGGRAPPDGRRRSPCSGARRMTNPLLELEREGQSVWLDYLHRKILETGELTRLIDEDGLTGIDRKSPRLN